MFCSQLNNKKTPEVKAFLKTSLKTLNTEFMEEANGIKIQN